MSITAAQMTQIRHDTDAALQAVAAKHGLKSFAATKGTYGADNFNFKIEGVIAGGLGPDAERYERYAASMGMPPLYRKFSFKFTEYQIVGMNTTGSKVLAKNLENDKVYLFRADYIKVVAA